MAAEESLDIGLVLTGSTATALSPGPENGNDSAWRSYPNNLSAYNPLTEWGEHYQKVLDKDLWSSRSTFDVQELSGRSVTQRRVTGAKQVDGILAEDEPEIRILYCDSKLCSDLVTRASFAKEDILKIFSKYNFSPVFLDRFIGRNRCVTGSRKIRDPQKPSTILSYDIWYDLPCRIYNSEIEYDWHFVLFTVYAHYDAVAKKSVLFYIHRLGSEHPSSAEISSNYVKSRIKSSLEHLAHRSEHAGALNGAAFVMQLPTITCCTVFWTATLHTERLDMWKKEDEAKEDLSSVNILSLHNINRYVHSYIANIKIASQSLDFVSDEHTWFAKHVDRSGQYGVSPWFETTSDCLRSQQFQMQVILTWTEEVLTRNSNLIQLYFNRVSQMTSRTTTKIAAGTYEDAVSMRTVALVTMFFLPATLVSAVFAMPFSQHTFDGISLIWVYFTVTAVLTTSVLAAWAFWLKVRVRPGSKSEVSDFSSFI